MPQYRRAFVPGGRFFFTLVTYRRKPFLSDPLARKLLHRAIAECVRDAPFTIDAIVLLPDHLHALWTLPPGDADFSTRWSRIKKAFARTWLANGGWEGAISASRMKNRRRGVWQRRFWEHAIRDQNDYNAHLNYICYNPVKHDVARCPHAWKWSSFRRFVEREVYDLNWCCVCNGRSASPPDFGALDVDGIEMKFGE